jgi:EpsI family protein
MMGIVAEIIGPELIDGIAHAFSGWAVFMLSLFIVLLEMKLLQKVRIHPCDRPSRTADRTAGKDTVNAVSESNASPDNKVLMDASRENPAVSAIIGHQASSGYAGRHWKFVAAVLMLISTLALSVGFDTRETVPIRQSLEQFPSQIGEWHGTHFTMDSEMLSELQLSDYAMMEYTRPDKQSGQLYIAYYASQRKGQSCHSPATCLPGTGWVFEQSGILTLKTPNYGEGFLTISRAFIQKLGDKQLVYYWFPQRGRILTNLFELKLYTFWDIFALHRSDGALVRLITRVSDSERVEDADKRMQEVTGLVVPLLDQFVPGKNIN